MKQKIEIYGIPPETKQQLKQLAINKYGKPNISHLMKQLINQVLLDYDGNKPNSSEKNNPINKQFRIRLNKDELEKLNQLAKSQLQKPGAFAADILTYYLTNNPSFSTAEIDALYQSNYQLLRIGRNINQIAKMINSLEGKSLNYEAIKSIQNQIDKHTQNIGEVLLANRKRFEKLRF